MRISTLMYTKIFVMIVLNLFINDLNAIIEKTEECSLECILVKEFHNNECAFVQKDSDIEIQKKCFDITEKMFQVSGDKKYLIALGEDYLDGIGVNKNIYKGLQLYEEVANSESVVAAVAQSTLGILYVSGMKVKKDLKKAEYWLKKAAVNSPEAQLFYAALLEQQSKDKESLYWYKKAAKNNVPRAKYKLANLFIKGHSIGINRKEAYKLLHSAAEQNFAPAFQALGIMYEKDNDKKNSNYWYCKFANSTFFKNLELGIEPNEALDMAIIAEKKEKYVAKVRKEKEENAKTNKSCQ